MKISKGLVIIAIATIISFLIATTPTGADPGLGGLILMFWPPIVGLAAAIIFLVICAITKNKKARVLSVVLLTAYLIYMGIGLYVGKNWPLVY